MKLSRKFVAPIVSTILLALVGAAPAQAAPEDSIALYFSAPFVTGTHVTDAVKTATFNDFGAGATSGSVACPSSIPDFGTLTFTSGNCTIGLTANNNPGSSEQAVGTPLSSFVNKTADTTFTFAEPVKYVGFWWMMGSNGNNVEFLSSTGATVTSLNVNDVITFLGSNSLVTNADTRTVTTVEGGTHLKKRFYRTPSNYTGTVADPVMNYDVDSWANEPWIYLNLFVSGNVEVSKVRFSGANFEMDNLSVSTVEAGPRGDMVLVKSVLNTPPVAQVIQWAPTNTSVTDSNPEVTPNALANLVSPLSGGGAISYRVIDAGSSGCSVNSSTGVITYSAIGTCVVRATAAAVAGTYYTAYKDATFTFASTPVAQPGNEEEELAVTGSNSPMNTIGFFGLLFVLVGSALLSVRKTRRAQF